MLPIYLDIRCLQDARFQFRGVGRHVSGVIRYARRWMGPSAELIGIVDLRLPDLPPSYGTLLDRIVPSAAPAMAEREGIFVGCSPMTHSQARFGTILGRPDIVSCAIFYDLIPLDFRDRYLTTPSVKLEYMEALAWTRLYDLFFPISRYSSRRLADVLAVPADRTFVTGACIPAQFLNREWLEPLDALPTRFRPANYILVVGGGDARKNVECVIIAHARLRAAGSIAAGLTIVGGYDAASRQRLLNIYLREGGRVEDVEFLEGLTDESLALLYHHALFLACPSRVEGFSLPAVEAIACGCPVLASDCEAHIELFGESGVLFSADSPDELAALMKDLHDEPARRSALYDSQKSISAQFAESEVAHRLWTRVRGEYEGRHREQSSGSRRQKPRLAFIGPYPPDRSGVADYTRACLRSVSKYAEIDVFTNAAGIAHDDSVARFSPISALPYVSGQYDRVISIVGNSHFHFDIVDLLVDYGGACISHDNRLLDFYNARIGTEGAARMATRSLGRNVTVGEVQTWLAQPHLLQTLFLDEVTAAATPLIVHSQTLQSHIEKHYGVRPRYLPFCVYRQFADDSLSHRSRVAARERLGLSPGQVVIVTLGDVNMTKAPFECVWALEQLCAWGMDASLHFVGPAAGLHTRIQDLAADLGMRDRVLTMTDRVSNDTYLDYLLAADFAIQFRTHFFGGLSGALLDCIAAGLPTVANRDLAEAMVAPDFILRVPDHLSPTLVAEAIMNAYEVGIHQHRLSDARRTYVEGHSFDSYSEQLMEILELAEPKRMSGRQG